MKALVTGVEGFVGPYLVKELRKHGYVPVGTYFHHKPDLPEAFDLHELDIRDGEKVRSVVQKVKPQAVFHLAAFAHPAGSTEREKEVWEVNEGGTRNLLVACDSSELKPKIVLVGSAQEYGHPEKVPIPEDHPLRPQNPYAKSKVAAEKIAMSFLHRLPIVFTRSFNHTGPGHADCYVLPSFAKQIALIEKGKKEPVIRAGNLELRREFLHVRDVVRAYRLLVEKGRAGEAYNVASGRAYKIGQLLDWMLAFAGVRSEVVQDPSLFRPDDPPVIEGDPTKIARDTGWAPRIHISTLLKELLEFWRERVQGN